MGRNVDKGDVIEGGGARFERLDTASVEVRACVRACACSADLCAPCLIRVRQWVCDTCQTRTAQFKVSVAAGRCSPSSPSVLLGDDSDGRHAHCVRLMRRDQVRSV
jgi:hypothetical protein